MREIPLSKGWTAWVDEEDYENLARYTWCALEIRGGKKFYAVRNSSLRSGPRKTLLMHREILQASSPLQVDHVDGNGLNNQRSNLRLATSAENAHNQASRGGTSSFKGVTRHKKAGSWQAQIKVSGKHQYLGLFKSEIDAARAYDRAAIELHGKFARLNFPDQQEVV